MAKPLVLNQSNAVLYYLARMLFTYFLLSTYLSKVKLCWVQEVFAWPSENDFKNNIWVKVHHMQH